MSIFNVIHQPLC